MLDRTRPESGSLRNVSSRDTLTIRFKSCWRLGVEGIVSAGRVIIEAKAELEHGQFLDWVEQDLKLGELKAQRLMLISRHPIISNPSHWDAFPPSWRTLFELAHIRPPRMLQLIESGEINSFMTREDAIALMPGKKQDGGKLMFSSTLSQLLRQNQKLSVQQAVAALQAQPGDVAPEQMQQLGRWLIQVAKLWRQKQ